MRFPIAALLTLAWAGQAAAGLPLNQMHRFPLVSCDDREQRGELRPGCVCLVGTPDGSASICFAPDRSAPTPPPKKGSRTDRPPVAK